MKRNEPSQGALQYTETEIRSYLPTGWGLSSNRPAGWDAKKKLWRAFVLDNVDFDYPVEVKPDAAGKLGRLEALRVAMDKVFRERLG
jgi:hypothetical protein